MATLIGKTLGKYKLTELLGCGGMAEVYKARHPQLDRQVTIKVLYSYLAEGEDFLARFKHEAKAVAAGEWEATDTYDQSYMTLLRNYRTIQPMN